MDETPRHPRLGIGECPPVGLDEFGHAAALQPPIPSDGEHPEKIPRPFPGQPGPIRCRDHPGGLRLRFRPMGNFRQAFEGRLIHGREHGIRSGRPDHFQHGSRIAATGRNRDLADHVAFRLFDQAALDLGTGTAPKRFLDDQHPTRTKSPMNVEHRRPGHPAVVGIPGKTCPVAGGGGGRNVRVAVHIDHAGRLRRSGNGAGHPAAGSTDQNRRLLPLDEAGQRPLDVSGPGLGIEVQALDPTAENAARSIGTVDRQPDASFFGCAEQGVFPAPIRDDSDFQRIRHVTCLCPRRSAPQQPSRTGPGGQSPGPAHHPPAIHARPGHLAIVFVHDAI